MRSIGIVDLLKHLSQRSGSLRVHAYSAILLTHLHMPGAVEVFTYFFHSPFLTIYVQRMSINAKFLRFGSKSSILWPR
jgi:hypothetical protein